MKGFFVCATDTGVGKTAISAGIAMALRDKGYDVGVMKPVQSGCSDAEFLKMAAETDDEKELINPYCFKEPVSPHMAAILEGRQIDMKKIKTAFTALAERHQVMIVEGAGGLLVPLGNELMISDIIMELNLPVIVVARPGLGTINHTLLTIRCLKDMGADVAGIIINYSEEKTKGMPENTNPDAIKVFSGEPILGIVPFVKTLHVETFCFNGLKVSVKDSMDWRSILKFL